MSHFTNLKTSFRNSSYLKKALNVLNVSYKHLSENNSNLDFNSIKIPQSNGYDITFVWNGQEYDLIVDISFWDQPYPLETFIDKIAQEYAGETVIGESQKLGFQPVSYKKNDDGSNILILERWNQGGETYL